MSRMKPTIGVTPLWDDKLESLWMVPGYMDGIAAAGGIPVITPLTSDRGDLERLVQLCDGLLFTGGHDVTPSYYGERPLDGLVETCPARDAMEFTLFELALAAAKPLFGICRGIQLFNVAFGGTLYQDLPSQRPSEIVHTMTTPYDRAQHWTTLEPGSPLRTLLGVETFGMLYFAEIRTFEKELHSEIEKILLTDTLPENWTYPLIQPRLIEEANAEALSDISALSQA